VSSAGSGVSFLAVGAQLAAARSEKAPSGGWVFTVVAHVSINTRA